MRTDNKIAPVFPDYIEVDKDVNYNRIRRNKFIKIFYLIFQHMYMYSF